MDIPGTFASQAYSAARKVAAPLAQDHVPSGGPDFGQMARSFTETLNRGETTARAALTGGADPHALVEALASSQMAVETVATVRDRVVEAYQEILRMPI